MPSGTGSTYSSYGRMLNGNLDKQQEHTHFLENRFGFFFFSSWTGVKFTGVFSQEKKILSKNKPKCLTMKTKSESTIKEGEIS